MSGFFPAGSILSGIGSIMGGIGASQQAQATNKAGQQSLAELLDQLYIGQLQQIKAAKGSQAAQQWYDANVPQDVKDRLFGTADYTVNTIPVAGSGGARAGGGFTGKAIRDAQQLQQQPGDVQANQKIVKGVKGKFDKSAFFSDTTPGYLQQMTDLQKQYGNMGLQSLAESRGIEQQAASYGQGQRKNIETNANRALTQANRSTAAQLAAAGLGNTSLGASMQAGNANNIYRNKQEMLNNLDDQTVQFLTGLRQNTMNLGLQNQSRNLQLAQAPIAANMQLSSSAAFNPFLSRDTTQYYPGLSPSAAMLQTFGSSLAGAGGTMMGYGLQKQGGGTAMSGGGSLGGMFA